MESPPYPQLYPPLAQTCPQAGGRLIHRPLQTFHWANGKRLGRLINTVERSGLAGNGGPRRSSNREASSQGRGHSRLEWLKGGRSRASGMGRNLSGGNGPKRVSASLGSVGRAIGRRRSKASLNNGSRSHRLWRRRRRPSGGSNLAVGERRRPQGRPENRPAADAGRKPRGAEKVRLQGPPDLQGSRESSDSARPSGQAPGSSAPGKWNQGGSGGLARRQRGQTRRHRTKS